MMDIDDDVGGVEQHDQMLRQVGERVYLEFRASLKRCDREEERTLPHEGGAPRIYG